MLLSNKVLSWPPSRGGHCAWVNSYHPGAPRTFHQHRCWGSQKSGSKGPSQLKSSPEVTGKQDVGSFRLHHLRARWGEVVRHRKGITGTASQGALGRSLGHDGKTGCPGPNASKKRQGLGEGVCLGDAPRKHGEGVGMGDREGGQGE